MRSKLFCVTMLVGALSSSAAAQEGPAVPEPKVRDHRKAKPEVRDHRKAKPEVRDHRKAKPEVRDHRKAAPEVRDHRKAAPEVGDHPKADDGPTVRDHRTNSDPPPAHEVRKNEVVPSRRGAASSPPGHDRRPGMQRWNRQLPLITAFGPRQGRAGTNVTVHGRNFHPGTTLKVNGQVIPSKSIKPDAITFAMPAVEGEASITLAHPGARRDLIVGSFGFQAAPVENWKKIRKSRLSAAENRWKERRAQMQFEKARNAREAARVQREAERAASREARRAERLAELRAEWEMAFLGDEQSVLELAIHAERMAKLQRMLRLAESLDKGQLVARIEVSMESEDQRHERRMGVLKTSFSAQGGFQ